MFLKKFLKSSESSSNNTPVAPPAGVHTMGVSLQNKFAKGINYNMKIVVRGDRNVGKTCLHLRLQGHKFKEEYIPTHQIQVASIHWTYKGGQDIIKVEVWDVVDKGRKKNPSDSLKIDPYSNDLPDENCLDAEFVDVYKGTHGVILVFDVTKQWTFSYVEKEAAKIPEDIPVLLLGNYIDIGHHRTVTTYQVKGLLEQLQEGRSGQVMAAESSLKNGFGLKYVHKFLNLPFLYLQKCSLQSQMVRNGEEVRGTIDELEGLDHTEEQDYELFKESLNNRRLEQQQQRNGNKNTVDNNTKQQPSPTDVKPTRQAPPAQPFPSIHNSIFTNSLTTKTQKQQSTQPSTPPTTATSITFKTTTTTTKSLSTTPKTSTTKTTIKAAESSTKTTKTTTKKNKNKDIDVTLDLKNNLNNSQQQQPNITSPKDSSHNKSAFENVEEFTPDGDESFDSFLDAPLINNHHDNSRHGNNHHDNKPHDNKSHSNPNKKASSKITHRDDDDDDDDDDLENSHNPLVASFQDDFCSSNDEEEDDHTLKQTTAADSSNKSKNNFVNKLKNKKEVNTIRYEDEENDDVKGDDDDDDRDGDKGDEGGDKGNAVNGGYKDTGFGINGVSDDNDDVGDNLILKNYDDDHREIRFDFKNRNGDVMLSNGSINSLKDLKNTKGSKESVTPNGNILQPKKISADNELERDKDENGAVQSGADNDVERKPTYSFNAADMDFMEEKFIKKAVPNGNSEVLSTSTTDDDGGKKRRKKKKKKTVEEEDDDDDEPEKTPQKSKDKNKTKSEKSKKNKSDKKLNSEKKKNKKEKYEDDFEDFLTSPNNYEAL